MKKSFVVAVLFGGLFTLPGLKADAAPSSCSTNSPSVGGVGVGVGSEPSYSRTPWGPVPIDHTIVCVYQANEHREIRHSPGLSVIKEPYKFGGISALVGDGVYQCDFYGRGQYLCASGEGGAIVYASTGGASLMGSGSACEYQDSYPQYTCYALQWTLAQYGTSEPRYSVAVCEQRYDRPGLTCQGVNQDTAKYFWDTITMTRVSNL